jgi:hypothetical protein
MRVVKGTFLIAGSVALMVAVTANLWHLKLTTGGSDILTGYRVRPSILNGGSRKGSKGNAVRAPLHARNAAAAPATVSGESPADFATESD